MSEPASDETHETPAAPAGWYPDRKAPGQIRYWDGERWTDRYEATVDQYESARLGPAVDSASSKVCPVCRESNAIQRVSAVIDAGTSATRGRAATLVTRDHRLHIDQTVYGSTSVTALAARLAPPPRPSFPFVKWFFGVWIGSSVVFGILSNIKGDNIFLHLGGPVAFLWLWIPALVVAFFARRSESETYVKLGAAWDIGAQKLRNAYYCSRDDVVFDGLGSQTPESFKASLFRL